MTTCTGASLGGQTRPLSSECVITSPPIMQSKIAGAEKPPRPELPPHAVAPLVPQEREVAVALDRLREHRVDDRFGRAPHDERHLGRRTRIGRDRLRARLAGGLEPAV